MGEGVGMGTRVSSTPGPRSFTPSQRSGPHSAHVGAWFRQTGGSNGDGPSTENNPSFWRLRTDRHCRSPRSGSTGTRMEAALESFTIVTTVTSPALGCLGARVFSVRNVHHQKVMVAEASTNDLGAALLEQAVLVPSNARWISLTMGAAKAFWGWVVGWGRTI